MKIQRVFFDLGLTLAESDVPLRYVDYFAQLGHPITGEESQRAYHLANKYFMRERTGALGKGSVQVLEDFLGRVCLELQVPELAQGLFQKVTGDKRPARWTAFPFTLQVLGDLRARGLRLGLISNWDPSCRQVLADIGVAPLLDPVVISSEVGMEKPDRRIFEKALMLSGEDPAACLYVGDNYYDDGVGASQVGMDFCILNPPDKLGIEELNLPWCLPDIRGVAGVVEAINAQREG